MARKKGMRMSGIKFEEEEAETFEIPTGVANNLKGYFAEKIAEAYLRYKIIPALKTQYKLIEYFSPLHTTNHNLRPLTNRHKLRIVSSFLWSFLNASGVLPINIKWGYVLKCENGFNTAVRLIVEDNGEQILNRPFYNESFQKALKDVEEFISGIYYLSWSDIDKIVTLKNALATSGYVPDNVFLAANIEGSQEFNVISDLEIRTSFELPILKVGKVVIVEVKSGKRKNRITFTKNQRKFIKTLSSVVPVDFTLLYVPVGDLISLREAQIFVYRIQDIR